MKVYICDFCESIIKDKEDRNVIRIKKKTPIYDIKTGFTLHPFLSNKYIFCPLCYQNMINFIERRVDEKIKNQINSIISTKDEKMVKSYYDADALLDVCKTVKLKKCSTCGSFLCDTKKYCKTCDMKFIVDLLKAFPKVKVVKE